MPISKQNPVPKRNSTEDAPIDTELPDWLQGADEETESKAESDLPAWMSSEEPAQQVVPPFESEAGAEAAQPVDEGENSRLDHSPGRR